MMAARARAGIPMVRGVLKYMAVAAAMELVEWPEGKDQSWAVTKAWSSGIAVYGLGRHTQFFRITFVIRAPTSRDSAMASPAFWCFFCTRKKAASTIQTMAPFPRLVKNSTMGSSQSSRRNYWMNKRILPSSSMIV